jgi:hypothetical protein
MTMLLMSASRTSRRARPDLFRVVGRIPVRTEQHQYGRVHRGSACLCCGRWNQANVVRWLMNELWRDSLPRLTSLQNGPFIEAVTGKMNDNIGIRLRTQLHWT